MTTFLTHSISGDKAQPDPLPLPMFLAAACSFQGSAINFCFLCMAAAVKPLLPSLLEDTLIWISRSMRPMIPSPSEASSPSNGNEESVVVLSTCSTVRMMETARRLTSRVLAASFSKASTRKALEST
eukprot:CAMPEP_0170124950 /NCGR_PEP_ID=MMETSP0020_2-20130122/18623_1 /TAXON_ID=98059 /ORGANISM="Dinobryon sp., Strain UTEXLB2267" /LENGTH=126 /DNA_ID=CAMNT_0010357263 /DNA_START=14 /DNA_END=394 /DNA_ORIENTATION=-